MARTEQAILANIEKVLRAFPRFMPKGVEFGPRLSMKVDGRTIFPFENILAELSEGVAATEIPELTKPVSLNQEFRKMFEQISSLLLTTRLNQALAVEGGSIANFIVSKAADALSAEGKSQDSHRAIPAAEMLSDPSFGPMWERIRSDKFFANAFPNPRIFEFRIQTTEADASTPLGFLDDYRGLEQARTVSEWMLFFMALSNVAWKRTILSLVNISASHSDPQVFFDNQKFRAELFKDPLEKKSMFLRAIRAEPALLQTEIGLAIQKQFSWDRSSALTIAAAQSPRRKYVSGSGAQDEKTATKQILLLLLAFVPDLPNLNDGRVLEILTAGGYCNPSLDIADFRKWRSPIYRPIKSQG